MIDIFEALQGHQRNIPGSIALASRGSYMNYEDFAGNIRSAAHALRARGVKEGQLIVLTGANSDAQLILALALLWLGCRVGFTANVQLYEQGGVTVDAIIADKASQADRRVLAIERDWFRGAAGAALKLPEPAADYAMIYASSGSTGNPKLIECGPRAIAHGVSSRIPAEHLEPVPRFLSAMGTRTAAHFCGSLAVLMKGGTVIGLTDRSPKTVLETIQVFRPAYVIMPPSTLVELLRCIEEKPRTIEKVAYLRTSGSRCDLSIQRAALEVLTETFISHYGSTETGGMAWGTYDEIAAIEDCVGHVEPSVEVAAFGEDDQQLPAGGQGEIRVRGPEGAFGRHIAADAPQLYRNGWFVTGDFGSVDDSGNLIIRGRLTNVINVGGSKVSPEFLEEHIRAFSQVRDVGVTGVPVTGGFDKICAAIVSNTRLAVADVNAHLERRQAHWGVHEIKLVQAIPRTESGKIDRPALKRLCSES